MTPTAAGTSQRDETIRQLLNRRDLAAARHRAAMSRRLRLSESEMLAVAHLAQHGQLTPSQLGDLLELSSGGMTALIQRLESAGHVHRRPHPTDGRSILVELSPALIRRAGEAFGPLVSALDQASDELAPDEQRIVRRFLSRVAVVSEEHAERARRELKRRNGSEQAAPVPSLWG